MVNLTDRQVRVMVDNPFKLKRLLDNSIMPEEHLKDYHNLNLEHQGHQPRWTFIDNWLEQRRFIAPCDRSLSYSEVVRQMEQGTVLVKTSGKRTMTAP